MYEVSVKANFSSAHHVRGHAGKCASPHGHNWEVEVFFCGERLNEIGVLEDFRVLKDRVGAVLQRVDHKDLNRLKDFQSVNPTSENLARWIYKEIARIWGSDRYRASRVCVREGSETMAAYWESP